MFWKLVFVLRSRFWIFFFESFCTTTELVWNPKNMDIGNVEWGWTEHALVLYLLRHNSNMITVDWTRSSYNVQDNAGRTLLSSSFRPSPSEQCGVRNTSSALRHGLSFSRGPKVSDCLTVRTPKLNNKLSSPHPRRKPRSRVALSHHASSQSIDNFTVA